MFKEEDFRHFMKRINQRVAEMRLERNLTQEKLAELMKVDIRELQRWETDKIMTLRTLYRFMVFFGRPAKDFFQEPQKDESAKRRKEREA